MNRKTTPYLYLGLLVGLLFPAAAMAGRMGVSTWPWPGVPLPVLAQISAAEEPPSEMAAEEPMEPEAVEPPAESTGESESSIAESPKRAHGGRGLVLKFGGDAELKGNESAELVVVIGGSAKVAGEVTDLVVTIAGNSEISGSVRDSVVSVLGSVKVLDGARIGGDVVSVGGDIRASDLAEIHGERIPVDFGLGDLDLEGVKTWFYQCVVKMRPLAPQVGWVWIVAGVCFLLYLLIALVFPQPIRACVEELTRRPAVTFVMSVVTLILLPLVFVMLAATGLGLVVIPFLLAALVLAGLAGKVAVLEWIGLRIIKAFNPEAAERMAAHGGRAALGLVLGGLVVTVLYLVPFLGLTVFLVLNVWGFGSAVMATFGNFRRELPARPGTGPIGGQSAAADYGAPLMGAPEATAAFAKSSPVAPSSPPLIEDYQLPKATFWERVAAGILDLILVGVVNAVVGGPPWGFILGLAYFTLMWTWRRTTIGGIVCNLKVVRVDGKPVNFAVALVRALGGAFSLCIFFLGFLWIAWDAERQSWHDKLAGTVVLRQPRATPLV